MWRNVWWKHVIPPNLICPSGLGTSMLAPSLPSSRQPIANHKSKTKATQARARSHVNCSIATPRTAVTPRSII
jgi:hypothetical protein